MPRPARSTLFVIQWLVAFVAALGLLAWLLDPFGWFLPVVEGKIVLPGGMPGRGAVVRLSFDPPQADRKATIAYTENDGSFSVRLAPGRYKVTASLGMRVKDDSGAEKWEHLAQLPGQLPEFKVTREWRQEITLSVK